MADLCLNLAGTALPLLSFNSQAEGSKKVASGNKDEPSEPRCVLVPPGIKYTTVLALSYPSSSACESDSGVL